MPNREDRLSERIVELQRRADEDGRGRVPVSYFNAEPDPAAAERLVEAGVDRLLFRLPTAERGEVERAADAVVAAMAAVEGRR
jgi:hypothetical protein